MPDPKPKLVQVNGLGVVHFPGDMDDAMIAQKIKAHQEISTTPHESLDAQFPPELKRIEREVGATYKLGNPLPDGAIASVGQGEPHEIQINDKAKWNQGPQQTRGHEIIHLLFSNLPSKLQEQIPKDDTNHPYDISQADKWRAQGKKLWNIPQEAAATLVQTWIADPNQRKRLQPWMSDLTSVPLSAVNPTGPQDKTINTSPRIPYPPEEGYEKISAVKKMADDLQDKFKKAGVAR